MTSYQPSPEGVGGYIQELEVRIEGLRQALPNPDILEEVAISLENGGIGPPGYIEHLRARAAAIRAVLEVK